MRMLLRVYKLPERTSEAQIRRKRNSCEKIRGSTANRRVLQNKEGNIISCTKRTFACCY